ncbi:hypothetical protein CK203_062038 [Vitis vinifera]|uniref:Uncharacterized protein n=1 Tax=Vitis vinifera TaxID=29760 RepID=A0A438HKC0_VITVI|nr:hypothetical protein CK203_062038 [Vitis vinifera]
MAATALCNHSGELEIVQLYHGHGRNSDNTPKFFSFCTYERKSTTIYRLQGGKNTDRIVLQILPKGLKTCGSSIALTQWYDKLDPVVKQKVDNAGFGGFISSLCPSSRAEKVRVISLAERWWDTTIVQSRWYRLLTREVLRHICLGISDWYRVIRKKF